MIRTLLTVTLLLTAACGFHPVYGVNKHTPVGVESKLQQVWISNIPDREGLFLRNALINRFYRNGTPENPKYVLSVQPVRETTRDLDITVDADATRGQLTLSTAIELSDRDTGEVLVKQNLRAITSYNILGSEFTNRVSEQNTRENALEDLARQIENRVTLAFKKKS